MSIIALVLAFASGALVALVGVAAWNVVQDWLSQRRWDAIVAEWSERHEIGEDGLCLAIGCGYDEFGAAHGWDAPYPVEVEPVSVSDLLNDWLGGAAARAATFAAAARTPVAVPTPTTTTTEAWYWDGYDDGYEAAVDDIFERDLTIALERNGYDNDLVYPPHLIAEMDCAS